MGSYTQCEAAALIARSDQSRSGRIVPVTLSRTDLASVLEKTALLSNLSREELQQTYYRFVALADRKKNIYDQDLVGLLPDQIRERRQEPVSELD